MVLYEFYVEHNKWFPYVFQQYRQFTQITLICSAPHLNTACQVRVAKVLSSYYDIWNIQMDWKPLGVLCFLYNLFFLMIKARRPFVTNGAELV